MRKHLGVGLIVMGFAALLLSDARAGDTVVIPLEGEITQETVKLFYRGLQRAGQKRADDVLIVFDTVGGDLGAAEKIRSHMQKYGGQFDYHAYVKGNGAWWAGAFLLFSTQDIFIRRGCSVGTLKPVFFALENGLGKDYVPPRRSVSAEQLRRWGDMLETDAQQHGHPLALARAMLDIRAELRGMTGRGDSRLACQRQQGKVVKKAGSPLEISAGSLQKYGVATLVEDDKEVGAALNVRPREVLREKTYQTLREPFREKFKNYMRARALAQHCVWDVNRRLASIGVLSQMLNADLARGRYRFAAEELDLIESERRELARRCAQIEALARRHPALASSTWLYNGLLRWAEAQLDERYRWNRRVKRVGLRDMLPYTKTADKATTAQKRRFKEKMRGSIIRAKTQVVDVYTEDGYHVVLGRRLYKNMENKQVVVQEELRGPLTGRVVSRRKWLDTKKAFDCYLLWDFRIETPDPKTLKCRMGDMIAFEGRISDIEFLEPPHKIKGYLAFDVVEAKLK